MVSAYILIPDKLENVYESIITSALDIADEVYVGNNKNVVDYQYLKSISPKVKPASYGFDVSDIRSICNVLCDLRRKCEGDWCLCLSEDTLIHEPSEIISALENAGNDLITEIQGLIFTKNEWFITHSVDENGEIVYYDERDNYR